MAQCNERAAVVLVVPNEVFKNVLPLGGIFRHQVFHVGDRRQLNLRKRYGPIKSCDPLKFFQAVAMYTNRCDSHRDLSQINPVDSL